MGHAPVTSVGKFRFDLKAIGYLWSIAGVLFLGAVAWSKDNPPSWYYPALFVGILTSIAGFAFRYKAHLDQRHEIERTKAEAEHAERKTAGSLHPDSDQRRESYQD